MAWGIHLPNYPKRFENVVIFSLVRFLPLPFGNGLFVYDLSGHNLDPFRIFLAIDLFDQGFHTQLRHMIHVHPISSDPVIIHSLRQEIIHPHNRYVLRDTTALCLQAPYQKIRRKITVADKGIHSLPLP